MRKGLPGTLYVAEDDPELLILLPLPLTWRYVPSCWAEKQMSILLKLICTTSPAPESLPRVQLESTG